MTSMPRTASLAALHIPDGTARWGVKHTAPESSPTLSQLFPLTRGGTVSGYPVASGPDHYETALKTGDHPLWPLLLPPPLRVAANLRPEPEVEALWTPATAREQEIDQDAIDDQAMKGRSIKYHPVLNNLDLFKRLNANIEHARQQGKIPVLASDIDGTLADARLKTLAAVMRISREYDGPGAAEFRHIIAMAKMAMQYGFRTEFKLDVPGGGYIYPLNLYWDVTQLAYLSGFARRYPEAVPVLQKMCDKHFHNLANWSTENRIMDCLRFLKYLRLANPDLVVVYCSLRGADDDVMPGGGSHTAEMLKAYEVWGENDFFAFKDGVSQPLPFDQMSRGRIKEPRKADLIQLAFARLRARFPELPELALVGFIDNDAKHVNEAAAAFADEHIYFINIPGDKPPDPKSHVPLNFRDGRIAVFLMSTPPKFRGLMFKRMKELYPEMFE